MNRSMFEIVTIYRVLGYIITILKKHFILWISNFKLTRDDFLNEFDRKYFRYLPFFISFLKVFNSFTLRYEELQIVSVNYEPSYLIL